MRGLIIYGRDGYDDGGEFVDQVNKYVDSHDDVKLVIADEISLAVSGQDISACLPDGTEISRNKNLPKWVMMRTTEWKYALALEKLGAPCFPPSNYIRSAADKSVSHIVMAQALASPNTLLSRGTRKVDDLPVPYIMKAVQGFGGRTVKRIETPEGGNDFTRELESKGEDPIYQEIAPTPDDLRVYIMGRDIMFAILRKAQEGSDKANFCQGAKGIPYDLSDDEKHKIYQAIDLFPEDLGFISIDFLIGEDGEILFNEMNCFPGLAGLVQMGWQDHFVDEYIEYIENACER